MTYRFLSIIALVLACTSLQSFGSDAETFEVKGVRVGMPLPEAKEHFANRLVCGSPTAGDKVLPGTQFCYIDPEENPKFSEQTSFAGHEGQLRFYAFEDRIAIIVALILPSGDFEVILKGMTEKYGKPVLEKHVLQNGFGRTVENEAATWVRSKAIAMYVKYSGGLEYSDLKFIDKNYLNKLKAEADAANSVKAKDM